MLVQRLYQIHSTVGGALILLCMSLAAAATAGLDLVVTLFPFWAPACVIVPFAATGFGLRVLSRAPLAFPWPRLLNAAAGALMVAFLIVSVRGIVVWPAAPIRTSSGSFVDKQGQVHTETDYLQFKRWEFAFVAIATSLLLVAALSLSSRRLSDAAPTQQ